MLSKRGQITIFVVLGIVIFFVVGIVLYLQSKAVSTQTQSKLQNLDVDNVKLYVEDCLKRSLKSCSVNGQLTSLAGNNDIGAYNQRMAECIGDFGENNLFTCAGEDQLREKFPELTFRIDSNLVSSDVIATAPGENGNPISRISVTTNLPITISKGNNRQVLNSFFAECSYLECVTL